MSFSKPSEPLTIGRYAFHGEVAAGGMATVHFARLLGPGGFSRIVAAKRLLPHLVKDQDFTTMLMDEARLAARIRHPNVVSTLDVVSTGDELLVVMDYVHGDSLAKLAHTASDLGDPIPPTIAAALIIDALHGLHAAHEVRDEAGQLLNVVHRDISPHNVLVGVDGVARIADFGIAKAAGRAHETRDGTVKGKLSYMAPEQIQRGELSRATDLFAISVVLWELLAGRRLFDGDNDGSIVHQVLSKAAPSLSDIAPELGPYDAIVQRGLAKDPQERYQTAREMALALESAVPPVRPSEIGAWVERVASDTLARRARAIAKIERTEAPDEAPLPQAAQTRSLARPASGTPAPVSGESAGTGARVSWARAEPNPTNPPASSSGAPPADGPVDAPARSKRWVALAAAVGLAGVGAYWVALHLPSATPPEAPQELGTQSLTSAQAAPKDVVSAVQPAPAPSVTEPPPSPSASARAVAKPSKSAPKPGKSAKNCDPPYSIDASGRRLFKLECM